MMEENGLRKEMKRIDKIKRVLKEHKKELLNKFKVKEIGLFGSFVRGEQKRTSDLDVLVEFKEPIGLFRFMDLEAYLKKLIKMKIDLVSKKALKPKIGEYILKEVVYI